MWSHFDLQINFLSELFLKVQLDTCLDFSSVFPLTSGLLILTYLKMKLALTLDTYT